MRVLEPSIAQRWLSVAAIAWACSPDLEVENPPLGMGEEIPWAEELRGMDLTGAGACLKSQVLVPKRNPHPKPARRAHRGGAWCCFGQITASGRLSAESKESSGDGKILIRQEM